MGPGLRQPPKVKGKKKEPPPPLYKGLLRPSAIITEDALYEAVEWHSQYDEFVFDVETRATRPSRGKNDKPSMDTVTNDVIWISLASGGRADAIPVGHPTGPEHLMKSTVFSALKPLFFSDRRKVNQNVKFDLLTIAKYYGEIPPPPYGDPSIVCHLLNENLVGQGGGYNLGNLVLRYLGYEYRKLAKEGEPMENYGFGEVAMYSYLDSKMTWLLWNYLVTQLAKFPKLQRLLELEMDLLDVLVRMQQRGVLVRRSGFEELDGRLARRLLELEHEIFEAIGHTFLITSTQQRAKVLYDELGLRVHVETEKGARSTSEAALKPLKRKHPVVPLLLDHAEAKKTHSTYVVGFIPHIQDDGRIRSTLNQRGAATGRFTSSGPNLQNIPRASEDEYKIRGLFVAPPGYVVIVGDYSMVELRVLGHYTMDKNLLRAFIDGQDLHSITGAEIFQVPLSEVTPPQRSKGKTANFLLSYQGGPKMLQEKMDITLKEANLIYDGYHRAFPGVRRWWDVVIRDCRSMSNPYVETLFGRRRRLPDIHSAHMATRAYAERQAVNHPIQGTSADLMKMAMVRTDRRIERQGHRNDWHLVLTVHDELIMEVPEQDAEEGVALMREAMEGVKTPLRVPLVADVHSGNSWLEAK